MRGAALAHRHCEERSDEAIQGPRVTPGLLRFARNDDGEVWASYFGSSFIRFSQSRCSCEGLQEYPLW
jgi:hypothetical protein